MMSTAEYAGWSTIRLTDQGSVPLEDILIDTLTDARGGAFRQGMLDKLTMLAGVDPESRLYMVRLFDRGTYIAYAVRDAQNPEWFTITTDGKDLGYVQTWNGDPVRVDEVFRYRVPVCEATRTSVVHLSKRNLSMMLKLRYGVADV